MATIGSKFNKYNFKFKEKVINDYLEGNMGRHALARKYNIPSSTVWLWISKYKKGGYEELKIDERGKSLTGRPKSNKINYDSMTDKEKIAHLEMEVAILKKLKAIQKKSQK